MAGSHVALGVAAWLVAAPQLGLSATEPLPLGLAVVGSLLPDIDHPKSWVGKRLKPFSTVTARVLGHRGITHSLLAVLGCGWLLLQHGVSRGFVAPLVVGYLSHLVGDLLTAGGLRLAWPLKGTWALPLCRTGSPFEPLVVALIVAGLLGGAFGTAGLTQVLRAGGICALTPDVPGLCAPSGSARGGSRWCPAPNVAERPRPSVRPDARPRQEGWSGPARLPGRNAAAG